MTKRAKEGVIYFSDCIVLIGQLVVDWTAADAESLDKIEFETRGTCLC